MKGFWLVAAVALAALSLDACNGPSNSSSSWPRGSISGSSYSRGYRPSSSSSYSGSSYSGSSYSGSSYSGRSYSSSSSSTSSGLLNSLADYVCKIKPGG
jgi:uncharacterized membrane protein